MPRIEVATPADILAAEDRFAAAVVAALVDVARRSAETLGADTIITAAVDTGPAGPGEPLPPPGQQAAAVEDISIIPALWTVQVTATLMPELSAIYELSGAHILTAIGEAFPDLADIPAVSGFAAAEQRLANAQNRLVGIGDMLWEQARAQLLTGFAAGEDIGQLRDRVQASAGVSAARAERIARTEVISASNSGSIDQVRAAGLVGTKEWLATPDERTRCTHRKAEGQTVDLGAKFMLGGFGADDEIGCADVGASYGDYPGDPALPAAEAINCRCSMAFDVDVPALTAGTVNGQQLNGQQLEGGVMPWHIVEDSSQCPTSRPYAVVKDATGQVEGCHPSRMAASDQLAALYAAEKSMAEQDCPEGEHKMPDGECMIDDEMPSRSPDSYGSAVQRWEGTLAIEGVETGDGRMFNVDALTWRDLPVPLMYQKVTSHGGIDDVTVNVGSIDEIWRDGNLIWARGRLDMEDPNGVEVERKMRMGFIRGVSIDADSIKDADVELVFPGGSHGEDVLADLFASPELTIFNKGRISAATVVNIPAFQEARLFLVDAETGALVAAGADAEGEGLPAADAPTSAEVREAVTAQVAAAYTIEIPDLPRAEDFEEPDELPPIGALWVTKEGRVFGLVGPGDTAHRSFRDRRVTIPMGNVDYAAWMNRPTLVQGGKRVATGVITMNCGHASPLGPLDPGERMKHYDNSCSIAAVVAVGESKKHGAPWVSGVLMPMTAEQAQRFMACQLSGDWAPHREKPGWREFVAALAVPVPGFARATKVRVVEDVLVSSAVPIRSWEEYQTSLVAAAEPELVTAAVTPALTDEQRLQLAGLRDRLGLSEQAKLRAIADRMRTTVATAPRPAPVPGTFEGAKQVVPCAPCAAEKQRRAAAVQGRGDRNRAKLDRIARRARSLQARAYHGHSPPQRAFHLPGEHNQKDHAGIGSVLDGIEVLNQDDFSGLYGDMADERSVELEGFSLTARYFDSGESAVVIDLPDDRYQVLDETSPEGMSQLAYDIEDALSQADDYEDSEEVVWDTDSPRHEFSVAVTGEGVVQLRPLSGDDFLELLPQEARDFANALHDLVASYEKSEEEGGFDGPENGQKAASSVDRHRADLDRIVTRVRSLQVSAGHGPAPPLPLHLPDKHDQRDHGRGRKGGSKTTKKATKSPASSTRYDGPTYKLPNGVSRRDVDDLRHLMSRNSSDLEDEEFDRMEDLQETLPIRVVQRVEHDIQIQNSFDQFRAELAPDTDAEALKADMVRRVREATADKPIGVRVTETGLQKILSDGRFKTQYETDRSGGRLDIGHRNMVEETNFGLPDDTDPQKRPIYGYVITDGMRPAGGDPESDRGDADALSQYGKFQVILKPEVRDRTTAMFGDSMNQRVAGRPSPINDPTWESFTPTVRGAANRGLGTLERDTGSPDFRKWQYIEAQVHGGVSASDIAEVVLPAEPTPATRDALEEAGIPWRVVAGDAR